VLAKTHLSAGDYGRGNDNRNDVMITYGKRATASSRLRAISCILLAISAGLVVFTGITSSRAINPRGSASLLGAVASAKAAEHYGVQIGTVSVDGPTPTPFPCPLCWFARTRSENFDYLTPPQLPGGWLATNALGPPPLWVTSNSGLPTPPADTAPNALFIDDPADVSDKRLDGWFVSFFEDCCVLLTFRHNFNLEASDLDPNVGFDGGVLELSTDNGNTFQDIIAAGGGFVSGGYNRTIATDRGSPIAGRQAWSGNSNGFITTVVGLPEGSLQGRLRWRMASDSSGGNEGWRVDSLYMTWCEGMGTPCPTPTPRRGSTPTPRSRPTPPPHP
jgi:hypothetical protein